MNVSHRFRKRVVKSFPMHDVNAIGRKLLGSLLLFTADSLAINLIAAVFHYQGMMDCDQQALKRSTSAITKAGHFLNT